jgi:hypothetical protein
MKKKSERLKSDKKSDTIRTGEEIEKKMLFFEQCLDEVDIKSKSGGLMPNEIVKLGTLKTQLVASIDCLKWVLSGEAEKNANRTR